MFETRTYEVYQSDVFLGNHWAKLVDDGTGRNRTYELHSVLSRLFPASAEPTKVDATLVTTQDFAPISLSVDSAGKSLGIHFADGVVAIEMPDGAVRSIEMESLDGLIDHSMPFLTALIVSRAMLQPGPERRLHCLLVNQLLPITYTISSRPDGLVTSLEEQLRLGNDGELAEIEIIEQRFKALRVASFTPPDDDTPSLPRRHYNPPKDANIEVKDTVIDGPVVSLAATLTKPRDNGPHPAVLFIAGSGSADRHGFSSDIDLGTHEIMDELSDSGFVGLRYDKRGVGETPAGPDPFEYGFDDNVLDAKAALDYLRDRHCVNPSQVAVIGHSEGAVVALILAAESSSPPAALVLLASPGRPIDDVMESQIRWAGRQTEASEDQVDDQLKAFRRFVEYVRSPDPWTEGTVPANVYAGLRQRRWLSELLKRDPSQLIAHAQCPILIVQGDRDQQILADEDAERLLAAGRNASVEVELRRYHELDHLLKPVTQDTRLDSYALSRAVDAQVIKDIAIWLKRVLLAEPADKC